MPPLEPPEEPPLEPPEEPPLEPPEEPPLEPLPEELDTQRPPETLYPELQLVHPLEVQDEQWDHLLEQLVHLDEPEVL